MTAQIRFAYIPAAPGYTDALRLPIAQCAPKDEAIATVERVINQISEITADSAFWAPSVLNIPARIQGTLQAVHEDLSRLSWITRGHPPTIAFVSSQLDSSPVKHGFGEQVMLLADALTRVGDVRSNGYLNALIPFLHIFPELTAYVVLPTVAEAGFMSSNTNLVMTIAQYHPQYMAFGDDVVWRSA